MQLDKQKFEKLYLGKEVYIKFQDTYLERKGIWIESNKVYKGIITRANSFNYKLEGETDNINSLLYGFTFGINRILDIKLVKKDEVNVSNTKRKH